MTCRDTRSSSPGDGQLTLEVRCGGGGRNDCHLTNGSRQPHCVTVTNLEAFPVYIDCVNVIVDQLPASVEFELPCGTPAPVWTENQRRVSPAPSRNSITLNRVHLVSRSPGNGTVRTTVDARWHGHFKGASVIAEIVVQTS